MHFIQHGAIAKIK